MVKNDFKIVILFKFMPIILFCRLYWTLQIIGVDLDPLQQCLILKLQMRSVCSRTNEDEGQSNTKGQDVASEGFIVFAVAFGKDVQARVNVVLA